MNTQAVHMPYSCKRLEQFYYLFRASSIVLILVVASLRPAAAQQTWDAGTGNWNIDTNWAPFSAGTFPNAIGAEAMFGSVSPAPTITLGQSITIGEMIFSSSTNYTFASSGAHTLTFDNGAVPAVLSSQSGGTITFLPLLHLESDLNVDVAAGTVRLLNGKSGSGGLIKSGAGTLQMSSLATFSGPVTIEDGNLLYGSNGALPAGGTVTVGDGVGAPGSAILTTRSSMSTGNAFAVEIEQDGRLKLEFNRLVRLTSLEGEGEVVINSGYNNSFAIIGNTSTTYSGTISGSFNSASTPNPNAGGRINYSSTGTLVLDGNNSFSGRVFISNGAIQAASNTALGAGGSSTNGTFVHGLGSLEISGGTTLSELVALNGSGTGGSGALRNVSGTNTINTPLQIGWAGGSVFAQDATVTVEAGSTLIADDGLSGSNSLTKEGVGMLRLAGTDARTGAVDTVVNEGTLALAAPAGDSIVGDALILNSGGTLMLEDTEQISDTTDLILGGGTFSTGSGFSETLGQLTLTADSTISLASTAHLLTFAASSSTAALWNPTATLTILGWQGSPLSGGDNGSIFVGAGPGGLTSGQLSRINFSGYGAGAQLLASGELVPTPIPESHVLVAAVILAMAFLLRERGLVLALLRLIPTPLAGKKPHLGIPNPPDRCCQAMQRLLGNKIAFEKHTR